MQLEVQLEGCRYIEDRDTRPPWSREAHRATPWFAEHWDDGLSDDKLQPWRIVAVGAPARA